MKTQHLPIGTTDVGRLALTTMAVTALLTVAPAASAANVTGLGSAELDSYIEREMWAMRTPGLAVLVVKDGQVLWSKGYGYADLEQQIPVTPDTVFVLASVSKMIVATAVMQLWEQVRSALMTT
jgi:CubicO group peptidase (beta-lactamase class C family)